MSARQVIARATHSWRLRNYDQAEQEADAILADLAAAGFYVIHRDHLFLKVMEAAKETP